MKEDFTEVELRVLRFARDHGEVCDRNFRASILHGLSIDKMLEHVTYRETSGNIYKLTDDGHALLG
jgi:hypothetical protein